MTEIDYEARVAKGVALLDEKFPGWHEKIDLDILDVRLGTMCVTAQLSGTMGNGAFNYKYGMEMLNLDDGSRNDGSYTEHGFNAETYDAPGMAPGYQPFRDAYPSLNQIWRRVISERRAHAA